LEQRSARGRVFELGGPRVYTFKQLLLYIVHEIDRKRWLAPLPFFLAQPLGMSLDLACKILPIDPPLTGDQVETLKRDNVVGADPNAAAIADLGVANLETVEAIVPSYLWRFRPYGQFQARHAG